jgi:hypothetical protein
MLIRSTLTDALSIDLSKKYGDVDITYQHKPWGLWYQINNSWAEWCGSNWESKLRKNNIRITIDLTNILVLNTIKKVKDFNEKYIIVLLKTPNFDFKVIDWNKVRKDYKGIELRNYHKINDSKFMFFSIEFLWLMTWDVDSGCIWDLSAIKNTKNL